MPPREPVFKSLALTAGPRTSARLLELELGPLLAAADYKVFSREAARVEARLEALGVFEPGTVHLVLEQPAPLLVEGPGGADS